MTDPERVEEPRPDRLPQIKQFYTAEELADIGTVREESKRGRHVGGEAKAKMYVSVLAAKLLHAHRDIAWLVAEVERLTTELATARAVLEDGHAAIRRAIMILRGTDDD